MISSVTVQDYKSCTACEYPLAYEINKKNNKVMFGLSIFEFMVLLIKDLTYNLIKLILIF